MEHKNHRYDIIIEKKYGKMSAEIYISMDGMFPTQEPHVGGKTNLFQ